MSGGFPGSSALTDSQIQKAVNAYLKMNKPPVQRREGQKRKKGDTPTPKDNGTAARQKRGDAKESKEKPPRKGTANTNHMDMGRWNAVFGSAEKNNGVSPCFFHWNQNSGCVPTGGRPCGKSHDVAPEEYSGQHFKDLSTARQKSIVARCATAQ
jgi:hypothetical protein